MKVPCKNCELREVGCHSRCDAYLLYKKEMELFNEHRKEYFGLKNYIFSACQRQHIKSESRW